MRLWRICRKPYTPSALDGIGGLYTSGRWHRKNRAIVYTATSASLQSLGESWLRSGRSAAWIVPSAVITVERNVLLNPRHHHAKRISILSEDDFSFDPRLLA